MINFETTTSNTNRKPYSSGPRTGFNKNAEVEAFLNDLRIFSSEKGKKIKKPIVELAKTTAKFVTEHVKLATKQIKVAVKRFKF